MQPHGRTTGRYAEQQTRAVITGGAVLDEIARHPREFMLEHLLVHDVAARSQHHGLAGARVSGLPVLRVAQTGHAAVCVCNEMANARIEDAVHARVFHRAREMLHGECAATVGAVECRLVAAWRRFRDVAERPDFLVAAPDQAVAPGLHRRLSGVVAAIEGHALRLEPVEVRHAALAISAEFPGIRIRGQRFQIPVHLLGRVVEAAGLLHRRAAAEIEMSARDSGGAARAARALEQQHAGAGFTRAERSACARRTEAHHDHLGLVVPVRDISVRQQRGRGLRKSAHAVISGVRRCGAARVRPALARRRRSICARIRCAGTRWGRARWSPVPARP